MAKPFRTEFFNKYFNYDPTCDAGYINIPNKDRKIVRTQEVGNCILIDKNEAGDVIGVEILGVASLMIEQGLV